MFLGVLITGICVFGLVCSALLVGCRVRVFCLVATECLYTLYFALISIHAGFPNLRGLMVFWFETLLRVL